MAKQIHLFIHQIQIIFQISFLLNNMALLNAELYIIYNHSEKLAFYFKQPLISYIK